jgi:hypothetical protein
VSEDREYDYLRSVESARGGLDQLGWEWIELVSSEEEEED